MLDAALERPPQERAAFLEAACAGQPEVRREVEDLLSVCGATGSFMETPALALLSGENAIPIRTASKAPSPLKRALARATLTALTRSGGRRTWPNSTARPSAPRPSANSYRCGAQRFYQSVCFVTLATGPGGPELEL